MRSFSALAAAAVFSVSGYTAPVIPAFEADGPPDLTAEAWILYDADADVVLAAKAANEERPMASVTKIMTALVVADNADLEEKVRVSEKAANVGESEIGLYAGERWAVKDLLAGLLIRSGNDAAMALAEHVGGSVEGFADMMNAKAEELGLEHSNFVNPHGLDHPEHYTSATDLVMMTEAALEDPYLSRLARTRLVTFTPSPTGVARRANTTNRLLGVYPGVVGFKTGYTGRAGLVLASVLEQGDRTLIAVVMGSDGHFDDTRELLDYGARTLTIHDRLLAELVPEQGGGGELPSGITLSSKELAQLEVVSNLPDGSWAVNTFETTDLGYRIRDWMRSVAPVTLGGTG